jgi:glucokinase
MYVGDRKSGELGMINHSRVALVGAFGGTYVSLAVIDIDELTVSHFALLNSADFESPMQAIERYLPSLPSVPNKVALSVAGAVDGDRVAMDHLPWRFTAKEIRAATAAETICLVNEFDALALALPNLSRFELVELAGGKRVLRGTRLAVSVGTGFGAAALTWSGEARIAVSGPARLVHFTPPLVHGVDLRAVYAPGRAITAEDAFSGRGLVALYRALAERDNRQPTLLTAPDITRAAIANEDQRALEALQLTVGWLAGYVGDLALAFGARGGVYLAGGMLANIVPLLATPGFRDGFLGDGGRRDYLEPIAINVVKTSADAGLRGAAIALAQSLPARSTRASVRV